MQPTTLILGLGNVLMTDEAVGAEVVRQLEQESDPDAPLVFIDGGTLSFTLALPIGDCPRLIVVDAAAMGEPPGSVRVFEGEAMDRQLSVNAKTVHEVSLSDLMDIARLTDTLPLKRALIGIEPGFVGWGDRLTPAVEAAIPDAIARIRSLLDRWSA
ncbi:HyaD/HybD family hydrogenase maturation endopeptidase [Thiocapsa roseopersicina]|uniref:Hydrogenase maturation protease n=1 Tax=Thiocapsa roseopersicina TaxID=1058 RepID=A0A1H2X6Z0_THIRO|nr:HyaD/HybD family hydrogenase maturation endopeptidase [Thiocapsa roseopersicina]SDW88672.1 hydrogenase maturation protease [Thiocapsa roseopersicina]